VELNKPPETIADRFRVMERMFAHSQYCSSGDFTLEATQEAIQTVSRLEGDEHFVFVISDANLDRYQISTKELAQILTKDHKVKSYIIFIAELWDEAQRISRDLPPGRGVVCLNTIELPSLFRKLLTTDVLRSF